MYFWNVKRLSNALVEGRVSEKEQFKYLLALTILALFGGSMTAMKFVLAEIPVESYRFFAAVDLIHLVITVAGLAWCYRCNRLGDGKDFLSRTICLIWPIGIRIAVWFFLVKIITVSLVRWAAGPRTAIIFSFGVSLIASVAFYWYLSHQIRQIARVGMDENTESSRRSTDWLDETHPSRQ